jgi:hypothetical protein
VVEQWQWTAEEEYNGYNELRGQAGSDKRQQEAQNLYVKKQAIRRHYNAHTQGINKAIEPATPEEKKSELLVDLRGKREYPLIESQFLLKPRFHWSVAIIRRSCFCAKVYKKDLEERLLWRRRWAFRGRALSANF